MILSVAVDPGERSGWAVTDGEVWWAGECAVWELPIWIRPIVHNKETILTVEKGYVGGAREILELLSQAVANPEALPEYRKAMARALARRAASLLTFAETCGGVVRTMEAICKTKARRPIASEWRSYLGMKTRPRAACKAEAIRRAEELGVSVHTARGREQHDKAEAVLMAYAALKRHNEGKD